jgi:hypothetical protein
MSNEFRLPSRKQSSPICLNVKEIPLSIIYLHKQIVSGNGDIYRERGDKVFTMIIPSQTEGKKFSFINDAEEVWLIYQR